MPRTPSNDRRRRAASMFAAALAAPVLLLAACGDEPPAVVATATATAEATPAPTQAPTEPPTATPTPTPAVAFDPDLHRLVDKERALPEGYEPDDLVALPPEYHAPEFGGLMLREEAAAALDDLMAAAAAEGGLDLRIRSTYRSFEEQVRTFEFWVEFLGEEQARRESAVAGHSEHQLGNTVDFASEGAGWELIEEFGETPEGRWLAEHAHEFGFAMSYPPDSEDITGYIYEPWHFRYIGVGAAAAWKEDGRPLILFLEDLAEQGE